jgi:hypothetical protein
MWVQLAVYKDASVEVLLRLVAERFVLAHDALEHLVDFLEVCVWGVGVAVDFVVDGCGGCAGGHELLDEEEVWSGGVRKCIENQ